MFDGCRGGRARVGAGGCDVFTDAGLYGRAGCRAEGARGQFTKKRTVEGAKLSGSWRGGHCGEFGAGDMRMVDGLEIRCRS